ncbi:hypothetical protein RIF25_03275 [Thermosynechococcaceae cyanobacterium BACA0444]|uniref:Nucleoside phosphorylase domain-containing protein n=1 Tax=Pseudocalidococcus azoricus BACA0444 TaxID=2918990 RepID=A0AAE4FQH8_9CYAN|nr:hypothetical protein [Pseudocalidococcus azoricus]MDS3859823.1 hypothetical protein [Pseudocalidococcus azoricus BACA0444]
MTNLDSASFSSGNLPPQQFAILVPQGQEHQAIVKGLKQVPRNLIQLIPIPLGVLAVQAFLEQWQPSPEIHGILVIGLAGALSHTLSLGQVVVYESCIGDRGRVTCDPAWRQYLSQYLEAPLVKAFTSPELVATAQAKAALHQKTGADVVDMEGGPILDYGASLNLPVAMVRVISDTATQDLPNLSQAIGGDGSLNPLLLTWAFLQKPIAAGHLITGSLRGLGKLEKVGQALARERSGFLVRPTV